MAQAVGISTFDFAGTRRFAIERLLGYGGMGVVYEAQDRETNTTVALKTLRRMNPQALYRLKKEFRALRDIVHWNLVRLGELVEDQGTWFFTMELVGGVNFLAHVRVRPPRSAAETRELDSSGSADNTSLVWSHSPARPVIEAGCVFNEARLRDALCQLARGMRALHDANKIHRDIKPSNTLVTDQGRLVLLDFGLAIDTSTERRSTDPRALGTAAYMAPEQGAAACVGPAADAYALGVMLYQALTGRLPFYGTPLAMVAEKQKREPLPPSCYVDGIPLDLDELCADLLRIDPEARPTAGDILARVAVAEPSPSPRISTPSLETREQPFLGRHDELAELQRAFEDSRRGAPVTVFVRGESGVGKTALIRELVDALAAGSSDLVVLSGRCHEQESVPYKALDSVIDALSHQLRKMPDAEADCLLPRDARMLARAFPVLGRVRAFEHAPDTVRNIEAPLERRRVTFAALRELLARLGERHPTILTIDDLQWADADSLLLLRELLRPPDAPDILLLISTRSMEPAADAHSLRGDVRELHLRPLRPESAAELARILAERAGVPTTVDVAAIASEAQGHPLYIDELVRHAVTTGREREHLTLDDAILARASQLGASARELLELICLAGGAISCAATQRAARMDAAEFWAQLSLLRVASFLRSRGCSRTDAVEPYHDRVREAILSGMSAGRRAALHARLAAGLEAAEESPELLLRHLEGAGQYAKAASLAEAAAERASQALAFDQAVQFYETAVRLGRHDAGALRALNIALSEALVNAGRGPEAAAAALRAARGADATTQLQCKTKAAEQLLVCGHTEQGVEILDDLLRQVGGRMPATPRRALFRLLWARLRLRLRGLGWVTHDDEDPDSKRRIRLEAYQAASNGLAMIDNVYGADFQARSLLLALRLGEPVHIARALGFEANYQGSQGTRAFARSGRLTGETVRLCDAQGDAYLSAWSLLVQGVQSFFRGKFPEASESLGRAEVIFRERTSGSTYELNHARLFRMFALRHQGSYNEMRPLYDRYIRDAERRGDLYAETSLRRYGNVLWLASDDLETARENLARAYWQPPAGRFHLQHWYELDALAETALYEGRAEEALQELRPRFDGLASSLLTRIQFVRCLSRFLHARLLVSAAATGADATARLRAAARIARALVKERIDYATVMARTLQAAIAWQRGDAEDAVGILRRLIELSGDRSMQAYVAAGRYRLGQVLDGEEALRMRSQAEAWAAEQRIAAPGRIFDVVAPGFR